MRAALRMLAGRALPERCPACGGTMSMSYDSLADGRERLVAFCHGSYAVHFVSSAAIRSGERAVIDELWTWMAGLFKEGASPDVREALAYNRGRLPRPIP